MPKTFDHDVVYQIGSKAQRLCCMVKKVTSNGRKALTGINKARKALTQGQSVENQRLGNSG
jgi:hypothetical protein